MRKTSFEYHIHGYRYAPESFHIYKGLPGQEKTELPLSDEQRYQMGYLYLTQGIKSAVDYVKHIERERERKCRLYMTYGFMLKENPRSYVYCADLRCRENDPPAVRIWPRAKAVLSRAWSANWMGVTALSICERIM